MSVEPNTKSVPFSYTYQNFATPKFYWPNHKYRKDVEIQKITISQNMEVSKNEKDQLLLHIWDEAGLGKRQKYVSDEFNEGTYMDMLLHSIKPLQPCIKIGDTYLSTKHKKTQSDMRSGKLFNFGPNILGTIGGGYNDGYNSLAGGGNIGIGYEEHQGCTTNSIDFETAKFKSGNKNIVVHSMKNSYGDITDKRNAIPYNVDDLSSLRCCNHGARMKIAATPLFGWFGGWHIKPDTVHYAPEAAKSSLVDEWNMLYHIKDFQDLEFEWDTEVRTVFASNDNDVNKQNGCGDYLNWIKTVHKITQIIKISFDNEGNPSIEVKERNVKVLSSTGYEKQTIHRHYRHLKQETPTSMDGIVDEPKPITETIDKFHKVFEIFSLPKGIGVEEATKLKFQIFV